MDQRCVSGKKPLSCGQERPNFVCRDQGPSSYGVNSYYEPGERVRYLNHELDGPSRLENSEIYEAELLRKLDELRDHLRWSPEVAEKRVGADTMISPALNDASSRNHAACVQEGFATDRQPLAPDGVGYPYVRQTPGFVPYTHSYRSSSRNLHFNLPSYLDTYQQEMPRGPYGQPQRQYLHQQCHECGNVNHSHLVFRNRDFPVSLSGLYNQRSLHVPSNPSYNLPIGDGPEAFSYGNFHLHTSNSQPSIITPNSTELDYGNDGTHENLCRKMEEAHRDRLVLHPLAGGAPFIACPSCFESLKLPRKHISMAKRQHKLKCGACSSTVLFELENKALTFPVPTSFDRVATEMDACSGEAVDENVCDSLPKASPADNKSDSGDFEKQLDPLSTSSLSKNLQMPNALTSKNHSPSSAHPILSTEECPHQPADLVVHQCDSVSKGTKPELDHNISWQNPVRDSTEIEVSSKEFPKSFISVGSVDQINELHIRDEKGAESPSPGHVKNSSTVFMKAAEQVEVGSSRVFVNWHLIPERLVQKAEVLAGPIQPGDYWYDIRAGFWGVMGYPCLGIIMPNIEEFNHPMPVECAAGNTEVFVNGRELHQRDLDLLAGRGLPQTRQRSYLIQISGEVEVMDADTGEELHNIGRLAPTVLRAGHGFGMKVPGFIARLQV